MEDFGDHRIVQHVTSEFEMEAQNDDLVVTDRTHRGHEFECDCGEQFEDEDGALTHLQRQQHPVVRAIEQSAYVVDDVELQDPKDPKTSAHPPDSRKFSDNQIYYLDVGPEYGDSPKLGGQFYTTVRRAGYRVVASHPDVHDDHRTRVWVEEREYATRRNRS